MFYLGSFVGGLFFVYLLAALWEWVIFKRVFDDPLKGKMSSVGAAWLTGGFLAGWGMADGGPYYWPAFLLYFPSALVIAFFAYRKGHRLRESQPTNVDEIFS